MTLGAPNQEVPVRKKVQVWIYARNPAGEPWILLLLTNIKRGTFWQPVTGSVEKGESLEAAALREAREETGLPFMKSVSLLGKPFRFERSGTWFEEQGFSLELELKTPAPPPAIVDSSEHQGFLWAMPAQALKMTRFDSNRALLQELLEVLRSSR